MRGLRANRTVGQAVAVGLALLFASCAPDPSSTGGDLRDVRRWEDTRTLAGDSLVAHLRHDDRAVRAAAARALGRIGHPRAVAPLSRAYPEEGDAVVRREIVFALGLLGHTEGLHPLMAAIETEPDVETTAQMALAVGRIGAEDSAPLLLPLLHSPHARIREATLEAMALLADSTTVDELLAATHDPVETVVWRAAYALEKIPGPVQVPRLVELAAEGPSRVRRYAVRSLGRIRAVEAADHVARQVDTANDDWQLRVRIADTLGRLGELTPIVRGAIERLLTDPVFHVRVAALQAIAQASWAEFESTTSRLVADPTVDVRAASIETAASVGFENLGEFLAAGLADDSPVVVATALRRLGETGTEPARDRLRAILASDASAALRLAAASGLAAETSGATREELEQLLRDDDLFVATTAANGLGARRDADAVPALLGATHRADTAGHDLTLAAVQALGEIADARARERLLVLMREHDDVRIRVAARAALERMLGPGDLVNLPDEEELRADVRPLRRSPEQPALVVRSRARQLILDTPRGRIVIDLFGEDAPQMVENFARLAEAGRFDGLTFHRVVPDFVIQGGDPSGTGWGDAGYLLRSEWNPRSYERGTVGIAHSGKDTGSCQLFITHAPQPHLDGRYTIWGEVVTGMEAVDHVQRGDTFTATVVWEPDDE